LEPTWRVERLPKLFMNESLLLVLMLLDGGVMACGFAYCETVYLKPRAGAVDRGSGAGSTLAGQFTSCWPLGR